MSELFVVGSEVEAALADAARQSLRGRPVTPFLLERLRERTQGESVRTNRALLIDNARVAAALAKALVGRPREE